MGFPHGCQRNEQGTLKQLLAFAERRAMRNAIFQGVFLFVNEGDLHMILPTEFQQHLHYGDKNFLEKRLKYFLL